MFKLIYPNFWGQKTFLNYLLWPLSKIYQLFGIAKYWIVTPVRFKAKVICVGNVNIGGTGKTQVVIWLAKFFKQNKIDFIIVTKGYMGSLKGPLIVDQYHSFKDVGDESILLAKYGKVVVAKKMQHAEDFINKLNPQVIIVDDGMQNPNFHKDLCILTLDGMRGIGNGLIIPAGPLRQEFACGLKQSDAVIIFNKDHANLQLVFQLKDTAKPLFRATTTAHSNLLDTNLEYFAFCGIGNPEKFFQTLKVAGFKLAVTKIFPDHHHYEPREIKALIDEAQQYNATLITTTKDYVKISEEFLNSNIKCFETELEIDNENELKNLINEKIIY